MLSGRYDYSQCPCETWLCFQYSDDLKTGQTPTSYNCIYLLIYNIHTIRTNHQERRVNKGQGTKPWFPSQTNLALPQASRYVFVYNYSKTHRSFKTTSKIFLPVLDNLTSSSLMKSCDIKNIHHDAFAVATRVYRKGC